MKTITICGSMKYEKEMPIIAFKLETKHGYNVLQCVYNLEKEELSSFDMEALREAHYKKIHLMLLFVIMLWSIWRIELNCFRN